MDSLSMDMYKLPASTRRQSSTLSRSPSASSSSYPDNAPDDSSLFLRIIDKGVTHKNIYIVSILIAIVGLILMFTVEPKYIGLVMLIVGCVVLVINGILQLVGRIGESN